jgi:basic membrane lipoprotein Med (substrate-binding protein (PBP1-ABC) superfamily)
MFAISACSKDDDVLEPALRQATVTFLVTPNGLGDNGYNDAAAEGIFAFVGETGTRLRLLQPKDLAEAEKMYHQWMAENASQDSAVIILGSSAYEEIAQNIGQLDDLRFDNFSRSNGSRILLFESNAEIDGVSTVMVSHYGVSYLAGAMSQGFDALIMAAAKGVPALEESIAGYMEARKAYAGEYEGLSCKTTLHYLTGGEEGFAMPDSAYRYIARRANETSNYDEMIFPLLGGSEAGVLRYLNDDELIEALMIGMDVDQTGLSSRIPFSVVIRIGDVIKQYLNDWLAGREWPKHQRFGLKDGAADIVVTPRFTNHLVISDNRYSNSGTFQRLYEKYKEEAIRKEEEYGK